MTPDNIDPVEFGEMRSDIKNISSTQEVMREDFKSSTERIESAVTKGFEKQSNVNRSFDSRIKWIKDRLIWLIATLVATGLLGGGAFKLFGG